MALEDKIDKLTAVIEKWIAMVSLNRAVEPVPAEDAVAADPVAETAQAEAPKKRRGRPPAEPVAAEPEPELVSENSPDEEAPETAAPEPISEVSPKPEPAPEVSVQTVKDTVMKVRAVIGVEAAKATVRSVGLDKLADIENRPELRAALYTAAIKALDDFENEV